MHPATLLVCLLALLPDGRFVHVFAQRDEARAIASSGLPEIRKHLTAQPNSFLLYYLAKEYERSGNMEEARENYQSALEIMDISTAILLLDEAGDETDFGTEVCQKIGDIKLDSGASRLPFLAHYFLHRGIRRAREGLNPEMSFNLSIEMDPFQISPRVALMKHYLRRVNPLLYNTLIGLLYPFRDFSNQYVLLVNIYVLTSIVLTISLFLFVIGLFIRHGRSIYHGILSLLPTKIPYQLRLGMVALIILVPIVIGTGSLWLWVAVVLLLTLFCGLREKTVLMGGSILLILAPIFSTFERTVFETGDASTLYRAQVSPCDPGLIDSLFTKEESPSRNALFSIGLLEKRGGHFDAAEKAYLEALRDDTQSGYIHNNLGNVYFSVGRFRDALIEYQKAIDHDPNLASAHYNLSQAYLKLMVFDKYTDEIETANKLDFDLVTGFINSSSEHPNRAVIDERLPRKALWTEISLSQGEQILSPVLQFGNSILLLVGCILAVSLISLGKAVKLTRNHCSVCGAPVCDRCSTMFEQDIVCTSCASKLKLTKSPGIQQKIVHSIKIKKARSKKVAGVLLSVLPGMGHIYVGSVYKGISFLFVAVYVLAGIVFNGVPYRPATYASDSPLLTWFLIATFLVLIGLEVLDIVEKKIKLV